MNEEPGTNAASQPEKAGSGSGQNGSNAGGQGEASLGAQIMVASELGSVFALCVMLGYFAGNWADGALKSGPYGVVIGLMVGMGIGLALVVKRSGDLDKKNRLR
jgi:F0F1-type ATP synthase assembly protein I